MATRMTKSLGALDFALPLLLEGQNFTPLHRTPWAGHRLAQGLKSRFAENSQQKIGESWEFSCDPDFLSRLRNTSIPLDELFRQYGDHVYGYNYQGSRDCDLLVKLIDTADDLSVQIHPDDHDPHLSLQECGKSECWYILDAEPGSGIFLGFAQAWTKMQIAEKLHAGSAMDLLTFVPVEPGDYFEIEAGVPHAIGRGLTLLEPQRVRAQKHGKTYRMFDWNRRYNDQGVLDPHGQLRAMHIEESLNLIEPERQWGLDFVTSLKRVPEITEHSDFEISTFPANDFCQLVIVRGSQTANFALEIEQGYGVLCHLQGQATWRNAQSNAKTQNFVTTQSGDCALLAHDAGCFEMIGGASPQHMAFVFPKGARWIWK